MGCCWTVASFYENLADAHQLGAIKEPNTFGVDLLFALYSGAEWDRLSHSAQL